MRRSAKPDAREALAAKLAAMAERGRLADDALPSDPAAVAADPVRRRRPGRAGGAADAAPTPPPSPPRVDSETASWGAHARAAGSAPVAASVEAALIANERRVAAAEAAGGFGAGQKWRDVPMPKPAPPPSGPRWR